MRFVGVIPARYESSRFLGKLLKDICGKPMIWWVWRNATCVKELDEIYVATDSNRIKKVCEKYDINVIMTSSEHKTGTDRIAEVATKVDADYYINIQGDEPLVSSETIKSCILTKGNVVNLMTKIVKKEDITDITIPKVVVDVNSNAIFLSRLQIPYPKGTEASYYKQVCVYKFSKERLKDFKLMERGPVEQAEDIEILRFIEHEIPVKMVEIKQDTISVDTPDDLKKVRKEMAKQLRNLNERI